MARRFNPHPDGRLLLRTGYLRRTGNPTQPGSHHRPAGHSSSRKTSATNSRVPTSIRDACWPPGLFSPPHASPPTGAGSAGPTTGITSGPYEPWQVAGCALTLTLAAVALTGGLAKQAWTTLVIMPLAFTVAWSIPASTSDGNGLWPVGAILIFGGMVLGALAVALPATYLRQHLQRRNRP